MATPIDCCCGCSLAQGCIIFGVYQVVSGIAAPILFGLIMLDMDVTDALRQVDALIFIGVIYSPRVFTGIALIIAVWKGKQSWFAFLKCMNIFYIFISVLTLNLPIACVFFYMHPILKAFRDSLD